MGTQQNKAFSAEYHNEYFSREKIDDLEHHGLMNSGRRS